MLFIAFHALAFIIMVDESTGCFRRECKDIIDEDGFWTVEEYTLSQDEENVCCKPFAKKLNRYKKSGEWLLPDCTRPNEDRTIWRGKEEVKFFMNNLS